MTALKLVLYFIVLIAILCLAYYTTKLVGNGMGRKQDSGGIRVLERTVIARDSFLLIVEIQGTVMVLGVSPATACRRSRKKFLMKLKRRSGKNII